MSRCRFCYQQVKWAPSSFRVSNAPGAACATPASQAKHGYVLAAPDRTFPSLTGLASRCER
jgi:hypothetical protein